MTSKTQRASQVLAETVDPEKGGRQRAALYARVSTERQAVKGYSIDGQVESLKAYATAKGWEIVDVFIDAGETGRTIKRPAYAEMMARMDEWDLLSVVKMDRIHRNSRNFLGMIHHLQRRGKDFDSMQDNIDTSTAMGRFVMEVIQGIAQLESEQISERTSSALGTAFQLKGKRAMGHQAPYGYRWSEGDPKHGTGMLKVARKEADEVLRAFDLALEGNGRLKTSEALGWCSCKEREIKQRKTLKDGTVKTFIYHGKKANCGGCERIAYILNNPFYAGFQLYQGKILPGEHEPLISRETFEELQSRRPKRRVRPLPEVEA